MADDSTLEVSFNKKNRKKARNSGLEGSLNINSLMDIMTILLVFLLVSITSDPWNVKQDQFLQLAESTTDRDPQDSIPIVIAKNAIIVDNDDTVKVECTTADGRQCKEDDFENEGNRYYIDKSFKEDGSESNFLITPLVKKLTEKVEEAREAHIELEKEGEYKGVTTIICDREIPYRMVAEVVHTAGSAGLDQLRFAIIRAGSR